MAVKKKDPSTIRERVLPFNSQMRTKRLQRDWSYKTLADKIGTSSKSYIMDIEVGRYAVSVEIGFAICQLLDIPIEDCLDFIYTIEHERLTESIQKQCQEWYENTPDEVRIRMMK
jgi:DNA-binding XRE family transcriptional regulator